MKEAFDFFRSSVLSRFAVIFLLFGTGRAFALAAPSQLSADDIVRKAVQQAKAAAENPAQPAYAFTKVTVTEERDSRGELKGRKQEADEILFRSGMYEKRSGKTSATASGDPLRLKSNKRGDYINLLTPELLSRFAFSLVSRSTINGRLTYEVFFRPRGANLPEKEFKDKILNRASGKMWIDAQEFELVRAQVNVNSEVTVGGGILGALKRAAFSVERVRLESGLWFEKVFKADYEARKLTESKHVITESECRNFRRLDSDWPAS